MNIQNVKEAMGHIVSQQYELLFTAKYLREYFQESIAELEAEQPAEDAIDVAEQIYMNYGDNETDEAIALLNKYAESYHAKKCAECTQKKAPYKLFGVD